MAALRSHGMVRIHVIKKLLDWPAVRLVRHQVEPGQVRQPSERHRPSTLCHPEAEGLRCVMSPAGRKPSVLDHWTGRHDSTQVLKRFSGDRHDRFRRPRGEDFGPELARVRNGFPAPMQRGEIGRPEGHKIRRQYARLDEVARGFGHTNAARYSVEDLLNLKLQRSGADGVPLPGLDPVRATVFRTRPRVCEVFMLAPRIQRDEREPGVRRERASRSNQEPPAELVAEPRVRGFDGFDTLFQTRSGWAVIVHRCSGASGAERIACSCSSLLFIPHRSRN